MRGRKQRRMQAYKWRRRWNTKIWYPKATDLPLTHVPEDARPQLRQRLTPWLRNMSFAGQRLGVQAGQCWQVAQALFMAAEADPGVNYVEGVWTRPSELEDGRRPAPHAWVTVDGHRVDLVGEFYDWRCEDNEWVYETLREYAYVEIVRFIEYVEADKSNLGAEGETEEGGVPLSPFFWVHEHQTDLEFEGIDKVFDPAIERLITRHRLGQEAA